MATVIDVVIPTYKPDARLLQIVNMLEKQTFPVRTIHLINTEKSHLEHLLNQNALTENTWKAQHPSLTITHIERAQFDHGATRNIGVKESKGAEYVVLMTQDAVPYGTDLVENLILPMEKDETLAASYARQLANQDAGIAEQISRDFNYPDEPLVKAESDFDKLGIKTYFCSNVCAAYRKTLLDEQGGFPTPSIFNEDMVYAGQILKAGYRIRYSSEAKVIHSHNYGPGAQFHRNFDLGVSQADHPEIFAKASSEGEGKKYVKAVIARMQKEHKALEIPGFVWTCAFRLLGYKLGKNYKRLPKSMIRACSSNKSYWEC